jgi:isoamylase
MQNRQEISEKTDSIERALPDTLPKIMPAHAITPGAVITENGIVFAAVLRTAFPGQECGLILFGAVPRKDTGASSAGAAVCGDLRITFSDSDRIGSLYSVLVKGTLCKEPGNLAYCYFIGDQLLNDPYARRLTTVKSERGKQYTVSALTEIDAAVRITPLRGRYRWQDRLFYLINVRGFTKSRTCAVAPEKRGTFAGAVEMIPYIRSLGVTTVELMPVYELCPVKENGTRYLCSSYSIDRGPEKGIPQSLSEELKIAAKPNLWGFGEGYYYAPKSVLAVNGAHPEKEFLEMVEAFHAACLEIVLQLYFPDSVAPSVICDTVRFYVTTCGVDGVHLMGNNVPLVQLAKDPVISDSLLFYYSFPYDRLKTDAIPDYVLAASYPPDAGPVRAKTGNLPEFSNLSDYNDTFMYLLRRFVKGDDGALKDFVRKFLEVPSGHGAVHYAADYSGFTLNDLVSYSRKHNEANGEDNRDGNDDNASWNCGVEGRCRKKEIMALRRRQMRNFLTLLMLAEGTPMLHAGDECGNSQGGNNNPYCQDNDTGWNDWKERSDSEMLRSFAKHLSVFRQEHAVFRSTHEFRYTDYRSLGWPDVSFHGREPWKIDFSGYSHSVGILYCEDYAAPVTVTSGTNKRHLLYLAVNMYWQEIGFGLPKLPEGQTWYRIADTALEDPFQTDGNAVADPTAFTAGPRSIVILVNGAAPEVPAPDAGKTAAKAGKDKNV